MNKKNTVKKNWEFQKILDTRSQVISRNLIIYFTKSNYFRVGISIPKQFANAVKRNHYRNQIRSILRKMDTSKINYDTILIARKSFFALTWEQKKEAIYKIYERITDGKE
ncbi:ribonuclease P protein component [Mycoplasma enhydrae]|uniref:ribonuclease P protein component n=1 Tax=Mycoplasma enhydrae TaxID=2499220 RepID=UPI00197B4CEC|nr:ribonuclease P protein component [Mycoplasma enhydrae]MBN4089334.1 ribonuclease P protein component [Mycoplasma enhydrae]MCV3753637.1 ribonuclease P protein component [Mycoplasma enhydrae]